jgi:nicotinate-nucleotide pyrophosphorylase (carboxylating)
VVARQSGVMCGLRAIELTLDEMEITAQWTPHVHDGDAVVPATVVGTLTGPARDLLTAERLLLNLVGRLSGVATLTRQYVRQVAGTRARIYDTRKTTPGWRRLEKFAVRCGGGCNHRTGLFDAVLIKDNHLAHVAAAGHGRLSPAEAVDHVRRRLREMLPNDAESMIVEVEVDSLEQLALVLPKQPDMVLLDNMSLDQLRQAVVLRDASEVITQLEASGGVNLTTVADIAQTGVDRISVGALTHSAAALDVALDWR